MFFEQGTEVERCFSTEYTGVGLRCFLNEYPFILTTLQPIPIFLHLPFNLICRRGEQDQCGVAAAMRHLPATEKHLARFRV